MTDDERKRRKAERSEQLRIHRGKKKAEIAEQKRAFMLMTDDQIAKKQRKYYESKKERSLEYWYNWRRKNPEICAWRSAVNRAWKGNKTSFKIIGLTREMAKTVWREKRKIARKYFRNGELHHDHMTPLSSGETDEERRKLNHFSNFVFIPAEANLSKNDKPFWEWFAELSDVKLQRCIAEQDAYNKKINQQLNANMEMGVSHLQ